MYLSNKWEKLSHETHSLSGTSTQWILICGLQLPTIQTLSIHTKRVWFSKHLHSAKHQIQFCSESPWYGGMPVSVHVCHRKSSMMWWDILLLTTSWKSTRKCILKRFISALGNITLRLNVALPFASLQSESYSLERGTSQPRVQLLTKKHPKGHSTNLWISVV